MPRLDSYLTFKGNCEEAFQLYSQVFGTTPEILQRFEEMPPNPEFPITEEDQKRIMHVSMKIGDSVLMGSDTSSKDQERIVEGTNYSISIYVDSIEDADRVFGELSDGGRVKMPMSKTFWGSYFGMVADKFKVNWMISCEIKE